MLEGAICSVDSVVWLDTALVFETIRNGVDRDVLLCTQLKWTQWWGMLLSSLISSADNSWKQFFAIIFCTCSSRIGSLPCLKAFLITLLAWAAASFMFDFAGW